METQANGTGDIFHSLWFIEAVEPIKCVLGMILRDKTAET